MTSKVGDKFKAAAVGRYMFRFRAVATATSVGQAPEGARFDILYSPDESGNAASTEFGPWEDDWSERLSHESLAASSAEDLVGLREAVTYRVADKQKIKVDVPGLPATLEKQSGFIKNLATNLTTLQKTPELKMDPLWLGLDATLVSGSDWMLVRNDGVAELSGRMAFKSTDDPDQALINMTIRGAVDLNDDDPAPPGTRLLLKLSDGLDIVVAATFEAGRTAPSWAPNGMQRQAAGFWKYERLTRSQFLAIGIVKRPAAGQAADTDQQFTIEIDANVYEIRNGVALARPRTAKDTIS